MRRLAAAAALAALLAPGGAAAHPAALAVTITSGPTDPTTSTSARFSFTASQRTASFECLLDGGRAAPCSSGIAHSALSPGAHRFLVVASFGRERASASWSWTVVAEPPRVTGPPTIHEAPPAEVASADATFSFRGGWPGFECSLDGAAPAACTSPASYSGLAEGAHEFRVRGADGGRASDWASHRWRVASPENPPRIVPSIVLTPDSMPPPPDPPPATKLFFKPVVPKIVAECAIVWEAAGDKVWYQKSPDDLCYTGSTAKAMTLHAALWALKQGYFTLGEEFGYSARAVKQACTCIGNYAKDKWDGWDAQDAYEYADVGEETEYEHALYGVAMSAAQPTVAIAELVAQAVLNGNKDPAASEQASLAREVSFVKQIMNVHTTHAGATNTTFVNEHGGDQPLDGSFGSFKGKSTARDMAKMWHHFASDHPLFLPIMGLVSYEHVNLTPSTPTVAGGAKTYAFNKAYWYYPKIQGDKNGAVDPPDTPAVRSLVASSRRLGRTLVVDVMHSDNDPATPDNEATDAAKILDHSFRKIFSPKQKGTSGEKTHIQDHALDCFGSDRCLSAYVSSGGAVRVTTWKIGVGAGKVKQLWNGLSQIQPGCVVNQACAPSGPHYRELDIAHLGVVSGPKLPSARKPAVVAAPPVPTRRLVVTAARHGLGVDSEVALTSWQLKGDGTTVPLKTAQAGHGIDVAVIRLSPTRFALARRNHSDGQLQFSTWSVSYGGTLTQLDAENAGQVLDFAFTPSPARPKGFVAAMRHFNPLKTVIRAYTVDADGKIAQLGSSGNAASDRTNLSITRVAIGKFAVAGTKPASSGDVAVNFWSVLPQGPGWTIASGGAMGWFPAEVTDTAIAPLGTEAVLLAARDKAVLRLYPMEYDARYKSWGGKEDYFKLGQRSAGKAWWLDIGLLQTSAAAAHAVSAVRTASGRLKLVAWEIGKKP